MSKLNDAICNLLDDLANNQLQIQIPVVLSQIQEFKEYHSTYHSMINQVAATGYMHRLLNHTNIENANLIEKSEQYIHDTLTRHTKKVSFDKKYGQRTNWGDKDFKKGGIIYPPDHPLPSDTRGKEHLMVHAVPT